MKDKRKRNQRLTSKREMRMKYFVDGVVKRGTSETWTGIRRWTGRLFKVLLLAAIVGGTGYGAVAGWKKFFWQNPECSLRDIRFTTDGTLTREQACAVAKLRPGANIYSYGMGAIRDALRAMPQVESVEATRYLPNRIEITVRERKPAAWLAASPGEKSATTEPTHLLDASGIVFQPRRVPPEFRALPVITGVQTEDLDPGKLIRKAEVLAALELLNRTRETGAFRVITVDVSKGSYLVATDQKRAQITFGLDDISGQIQRLNAVRGEVSSMGQEIATINLIPLRNIPVTLMQPAPSENDDTAEPIPIPRAVPVHARPAAETPSSARDRARPANKPKEPPKSDGSGILKRFRTA